MQYNSYHQSYHQHMKHGRRVGLHLIVVALCFLVFTEFMPEIFALAWHVRHGRTARLKRLEGKTYAVEVPTPWWADVDDGGWKLFIAKKPGRIRTKLGQRDWAMMSFSVSPMYSTGEALRQAQARPDVTKRAGFTMAEVGTFSVAGQDLYCFEQKWESGRAAELSRNYALIDLQCAPLSDKRSFSAWYTGNRALVPEFYKVLRTVTRIDK